MSSIMKLSGAALLDTGMYSDLTIKCKDQTYHVHKSVVCIASKVLAAAVDGNFREASTGVIDLSEEDPDMVALMVEYLYKEDYPTPNYIGKVDKLKITRPSGRIFLFEVDPTELMMHAKVYVFAEKYFIEPLKDLACIKARGTIPHKKPYTNAEEQFAPIMAVMSYLYQNTLDSDHKMKRAIMKRTTGGSKLNQQSDGDLAELCKKHPAALLDLLQVELSQPGCRHRQCIRVPVCRPCRNPNLMICEGWKCEGCDRLIDDEADYLDYDDDEDH